jgi:hypothetical protein
LPNPALAQPCSCPLFRYLHESDDLAFVDANLDMSPPPPPPIKVPEEQSYVTVEFQPSFGDDENDDDGDADIDLESVAADVPDDLSVLSSAMTSSRRPVPAAPAPAPTDAPVKGLVQSLHAWGSNPSHSLSLPPSPTSSSPLSPLPCHAPFLSPSNAVVSVAVAGTHTVTARDR